MATSKQSKNQQLKDKLAASLGVSSDSTTANRKKAPRDRAVKSPRKMSKSPTRPAKPMSTASETVTLQSNIEGANSVVNSSAVLAAGAGIIPVAGWDMAAVAGVQLKMLADLSKIYGVKFTENLGKSVLATLLASAAPGMLAKSSAASALKAVPGLGTLVGSIAIPAYAAGMTYAVGRVFIAHFESDGDLLSFSPKKFSSHFAHEVKSGMKKAVSVKL